MDSRNWSAGDWVVYRKSKTSSSPGPRAKNVSPAKAGESYSYSIDKYWIVTAVLENGFLVAQTLRGKQHEISFNDPALRSPSFWERFIFGKRFKKIEEKLNQENDVRNSSYPNLGDKQGGTVP